MVQQSRYSQNYRTEKDVTQLINIRKEWRCISALFFLPQILAGKDLKTYKSLDYSDYSFTL